MFRRSIAVGAAAVDKAIRFVKVPEFLSKSEPTPIPLKRMVGWYDTGVITDEHVQLSTRYLHQELPSRLARTIRSFENLPLILLNQEGMNVVFRQYYSSFDKLTQLPVPETLQECLDYAATVAELVQKNNDLVSSLSEGVGNAKRVMKPSEKRRLDLFIHEVMLDRIGRRTIAANHAALLDHYRAGTAPADQVGLFHRRAKISEIVQRAAEQTQEICTYEFGQYPHVGVSDADDAQLFCSASGLEVVLLEVLKNSMKATIERHGASLTLPSIDVTISATPRKDGVYITLSDHGGGMSAASEQTLWQFGESGQTLTGQSPPSAKGDQIAGWQYNVDTKRLSGYGFGLPLSKARLNYQGGDLWMHNMPGYGADTFIRLMAADIVVLR
ncbi:[Pyruvate dehydrogenase (acetyl-transferring)] kinase [Diplonema papillatum]|nr:[Pyruvate dehydrogenase (acetyl-transferring)] kinase [Diplonema papillatum]